MMFLGTSASESIPSPLCHCPVCVDARQNPRYAKCRSMFLLDGRNLVDFGPDLFPACHRQNVDLSDLENVFITHTHGDHFCLENMDVAKYSQTRGKNPLNFYLSPVAYDLCMEAIAENPRQFAVRNMAKAVNNGYANLVKVTPHQWFQAGGMRVFAVYSQHYVTVEEHALNYVFEKDGKRFLYACDSGRYLPESLDALEGMKVDSLAMDCTWGLCDDYNSERHLNCRDFCLQLEEFLEREIITEQTQIFATHVNHKNGASHEQIQSWFDANSRIRVTVALDGMDIQYK